jgi:hypothetical protein
MSQDMRGSVVRGSVLRRLSSDSKRKWKSLSVPYAATKQSPVNKTDSKARGVSLEMLQSAGVHCADLDDPKCKFILT